MQTAAREYQTQTVSGGVCPMDDLADGVAGIVSLTVLGIKP
ncbi:hypothetical protein [Coleofasciculus sp. FACHB-1120]|nr:hypothetical protein [Coleofasciculus sp. FACHB-1120]